MGNLGPAQARYDVLPVPAVTADAAVPREEPVAIAGARDRGVRGITRGPAPEKTPDPHD